MPTLPPPSFGAHADRYDRARPRYPASLIERIVASSPGPSVLDVGIGTGIAARQLRDAGCSVLGVDPDPLMASVARERYGLDVEVSRFEEWDALGRRFDAVVAAQAWHWVDPVAGAVQAASVLRPGGLVALFWNGWEPPSYVARALAEAHRAALPDAPVNPWAMAPGDAYGSMVGTAADGLRGSPLTEPDVWRFRWEREYSRDEWLDVVPTSGIYTHLSGDPLRALLDAVGSAIDGLGGRFTMSFTAVAVAAHRVGSAVDGG